MFSTSVVNIHHIIVTVFFLWWELLRSTLLAASNTQHNIIQFSSVAQSCLTLCDPTNCSMPGLPIHHQLPEFTQTCPSSQWCHPTISSSVIPFSSCPQSLPASESFPMSQLFTRSGQSIGVSALASVLPKNTQDWSLIVREMQIKTTMRYHLMPVRMPIIKKARNYKD